jgi:hypothetical protein
MTPSIVFLALALSADVPPERLQAALSLPRRTENTVFRDRVAPQWLPGGKAFWYRVQTGPTTHEFVLIDAETGARTTAEALAKLGLPDVEPLRTSALPVVLRRSARTGSETRLKLVNLLDGVVELFWINPAGEPVPYGEIAPGGTGDQHTYDGHVWLIGLRDGGPLAVIEAQATPITLHIDGPGTPPTTRGPSHAELARRNLERLDRQWRRPPSSPRNRRDPSVADRSRRHAGVSRADRVGAGFVGVRRQPYARRAAAEDHAGGFVPEG